MERPNKHSQLFVISYTISLFAKNVEDIFLRCVPGIDLKVPECSIIISKILFIYCDFSAPVPFNTTRAFVLWLWRAHNIVNERLMREEKELGTEDPRFPKLIWPSKDLCPSCLVSSSSKSGRTVREWNEDKVFKFIMNYYGSSLVSSNKDESIANRRKDESVDDAIATTHAVAVPIGAALAIAIASCAFGALACFWRTQQKNRKYLHHSLKNV